MRKRVFLVMAALLGAAACSGGKGEAPVGVRPDGGVVRPDGAVPGPPPPPTECESLRSSATFQAVVQNLREAGVGGDLEALAAGLLVVGGKAEERVARCF